MRKLSLANLAQNELQKNEANKVKGGYCICTCSCVCSPEDRVVLRTLDQSDLGHFISAG